MSDDAGSSEGSATDQGNNDQKADENNKPLGPEGEKALESWKQRAKDAEAKAKDAKTVAQERDALAAQLAEFQEASKSEHEKALEKARKEGLETGQNEANSYWANRILKAEIRAAAVEKFADPSDAVAFLDLEQFEVDKGGETNPKAIKAALDGLLKEKPHLARQQGRTGSADQGARGTAPTPNDMNSLIRKAAVR